MCWLRTVSIMKDLDKGDEYLVGMATQCAMREAQGAKSKIFVSYPYSFTINYTKDKEFDSFIQAITSLFPDTKQFTKTM